MCRFISPFVVIPVVALHAPVHDGRLIQGVLSAGSPVPPGGQPVLTDPGTAAAMPAPSGGIPPVDGTDMNTVRGLLQAAWSRGRVDQRANGQRNGLDRPAGQAGRQGWPLEVCPPMVAAGDGRGMVAGWCPASTLLDGSQPVAQGCGVVWAADGGRYLWSRWAAWRHLLFGRALRSAGASSDWVVGQLVWSMRTGGRRPARVARATAAGAAAPPSGDESVANMGVAWAGSSGGSGVPLRGWPPPAWRACWCC